VIFLFEPFEATITFVEVPEHLLTQPGDLTFQRIETTVDRREALVDGREARSQELDQLCVFRRGHGSCLSHLRSLFKCVWVWTEARLPVVPGWSAPDSGRDACVPPARRLFRWVEHLEEPRAPLEREAKPPLAATIRLVITDDHAIVLKGLPALFGAEPDLAVVADCTTGEQTIEAVRKHRPDVLVLDLRMRGLDGLAVLRTLNEQGNCPQTVLLTAEIDDEQTLEAVRLGAVAVVLKEMAPYFLVECIRKVHAGERWVERQSVGRALDALLRRETGLQDLRKVLTNRELDMVRMIVLGLRNAEIARRLSVSEGTVKTHLHHVYEKLGVDSRMGLLLLAQRKGLKSTFARRATPPLPADVRPSPRRKASASGLAD
jgi:DNA-binding NarL/FixJ family response regulator